MALRTIVALDVDDWIRGRLVELVKRLDHCDTKFRSRIRWRDPAHFHVTVKFLGWVEERVLPRVISIAAEVASRIEPFQFDVGGVECMPLSGRPKRIQVAVHDPAGWIAELHNALDVAMAGLGSDEKKRSIRPHIVLARIGSVADGMRIREAVKPLATEDLGTQICDRVVTYKCWLEPAKAVYVALDQAPLGARRSVAAEPWECEG